MIGLSPIGLTPIGLPLPAGDAIATGATLNVGATINGGAASGSSGANAAGATLDIGATLSGGTATGGGASGTLTITAPVSQTRFQRDPTTLLKNMPVSVAFSGAPTAIEARWNGGAWQTVVASPSGSAGAGTLLNCPTGQGTLEVRFANDHTVTAQAIKVTVGDIFISIGQSNNSGRAANIVLPANTVFQAGEFANDNTWKPLQEATTQAGSFDDPAGNVYPIRGGQAAAGSWFGAVSNYFDQRGVPVAFVPCAVGSTTISSWQPPSPHTNTSAYYGVALTRAQLVGDHRAAILWQGESDASGSTTQAAYETAAHALINAWFADTGRPVILCQICNSGNAGTVAQIRAAQAAVAASNPHVIAVVDMNVWSSGNVHYSSVAEINAVAAAFWAATNAALYPPAGANLDIGMTLSGGAASGSSNATAPGATLNVGATLTAGAAHTDSTAPGATQTVGTTLSGGAASGQNGSTAPGATLNVGATVTPGAAHTDSTAPGSTQSIGATISGGAASGSSNATAPGATINVGATLTPGAAHADSAAPGTNQTVGVNLVGGIALGDGDAIAPGSNIDIGATLHAGHATATTGLLDPDAMLWQQSAAERIAYLVAGHVIERWLVGDTAKLFITLALADGTLADPQALTLRLMDPLGATLTYTFGIDAEVQRIAPGTYIVQFILVRPGRYYWSWHAEAPVTGAAEGSLYVERSRFS